jgi:AcrR family transcriptional regulator
VTTADLRPRGRPRDPEVDRALLEAALELLSERGFARMSIEAVAAQAGVGKPAVYRRYRDKADLVAAAIATQLPALEPPDLGDTEAELRAALAHALPADGDAYVALIGGLAAEYRHHPELVAAFRERVLGPRRGTVQALIERGQERGDIRPDIGAEALLDLLAGPFLARVFAGADTSLAWRARAFGIWWSLVRTATTPQRSQS